MKNNFYKYAPVVLIIILLLAGAVYYIFQFKSQAPNFQQERLKAKDLFYKGGDNVGAIKALEELLSGAPTKRAEALLKIDLAFSYYRQDDIKKTVDLFKEVAADTAYPEQQRAYAVKSMADIFMLGSRKQSKLTDEIFSGNPYASFLESIASPGKRVDVLTGVVRIYGYASTIYPLSASHYRSAEGNVKRAMAVKLDKQFKSPEETDDLIARAEDNINAGEISEDAFDSQTEKGYAGWVKGGVLGILGELKENESLLEEADRTFNGAMADLKESKDLNTFYTKSNELWASFYYAAFLSRNYEKTRESDIKALLGNIINAQEKNAGLFRYLAELSKKPNGLTAYEYQSALALAKIDPKFAELLKELGWQNL